ncbi:MAG TPA: transporter associated domain-containing protein [Turneriella sp.]|nr:transporter associated domain-containing protein [Turneriella sp.]HNA80361.1 transporter associated domain-containing protein [Turneriella sp.]HNE19615.1 transporter associated domain-containing protein [Turneriella sp.]HNL10939.1 transporter associated domain-containing protein [Turneriella sp.]
MARRRKITTTIRRVFGRRKSLREKLIQFFRANKITARNEQMQMILEIIELHEKRAADVKTAEVNLVSIPVDASLKEIETVFRKTGHSRLPVFEDRDGLRHYPGVLFVKDLVSLTTSQRKNFDLQSHLRKPLVVPESQSILSLLREMRLNRHHLALTVNEHGDVTGMITLEDILEEIVGEIQDEYDSVSKQVMQIEPKVYRVDARMSLSDLNDELALNLPEEKFHSVAGFVLHSLAGELKEKASFAYGNARFTLLKFKHRQVKSIVIDLSGRNIA